MEIRINSEPIDFTLEEEKCLLDVVTGLDSWLNQRGYIVAALSKDKEPLDFKDRDSLKKTSLDSIGILSFEVKPIEEIFIEQLSTVYQFFSMVRRAYQENLSSIKQELLKEYPQIKKTLELYLKDCPFWKNGVYFEELLELSENQSPSSYKDLDNYLESFTNFILELMHEAAEPENEIARVAQNLESMIPDISGISVLLQSGKDKTAMEILIRFTNLMEKTLRITPFLKRRNPELFLEENSDLASVTMELNSYFNEIIEAFGVQDTVLIGDLLEYELAPRITRLTGLLSITRGE